jgi:hypothetical protein
VFAYVDPILGAQTWSPTWPPEEWTPSIFTVGGRAISGAGVPASYLVRTDRLLDLPLRIQEDEWADARSFLRAVQNHQTFQWYPDAEDLSVVYDVVLASPSLGEDWTPQRTEFPRVMSAPIVLRNRSVTLWPLHYGAAT